MSRQFPNVPVPPGLNRPVTSLWLLIAAPSCKGGVSMSSEITFACGTSLWTSFLTLCRGISGFDSGGSSSG